jgi:hypothetical protein
VEAAKRAGCALKGEQGEHHWSTYGGFNHDGIPFEYGDFMEWDGL